MGFKTILYPKMAWSKSNQKVKSNLLYSVIPINFNG